MQIKHDFNILIYAYVLFTCPSHPPVTPRQEDLLVGMSLRFKQLKMAACSQLLMEAIAMKVKP